ncbi:MAG: hypothetical protein BJ554DRAFT_5885, partial [Olpidium bornovanus]
MVDYAAAYLDWRNAEEGLGGRGFARQDSGFVASRRGAEKRAAWDDDDNGSDAGASDPAPESPKRSKLAELVDSLVQDVFVKDHVRGSLYMTAMFHRRWGRDPTLLCTWPHLGAGLLRYSSSPAAHRFGTRSPFRPATRTGDRRGTARRVCARQRPYLSGEDGRIGVRHRPGAAEKPARYIHESHKGDAGAEKGKRDGLRFDLRLAVQSGYRVLTASGFTCKWVIYDEVHYLRDPVRGVVWEETLILLPSHMRHVFLSATVPNAMEFAKWIIKVHEQPCHVVYTKKRPVPLRHYIQRFPGDGMTLAMDEYGDIMHQNVDKVLSKPGQGPHRPLGKRELLRIVQGILAQREHPIIVFSFGRKTTSAYGEFLAETINMNTPEEMRMVDQHFHEVVTARLSRDDLALPQIRDCLSILRRGIAVHHAGNLKAARRADTSTRYAVERLFQAGLIKILCATETFAMGVNMPARTVIFSSQSKFDGVSHRWLNSGDVYDIVDVAWTTSQCEADRLDSAFHLGYHMVLKLLGARKLTPEYMLEQSFSQFQATSSLPLLDADVKGLERRLAKTPSDPEMAEYIRLIDQSRALRNELAQLITGDPRNAAPFLRALREGMLVYITTQHGDLGWGVVAGRSINEVRVRVKLCALYFFGFPAPVLPDGSGSRRFPLQISVQPTQSLLTVQLVCKQRKAGGPRKLEEWETIYPLENNPQLRTVDFPLRFVRDFSSMTTDYIPPRRPAVKAEQKAILSRIVQINESSTPPAYADPVIYMGIFAPEVKKLAEQIRPIAQMVDRHPVRVRHDFIVSMEREIARRELVQQIEDAKAKLEDAKSVKRRELGGRKAILHRRRFIDDDERLTFKGNVGIHFKVKDELVLTELLMDRTLESLTSELLVALLSVFVIEDGDKLGSGILRPCLDHIQQIADEIFAQSKELGLPMTAADDRYYKQMASPILM